MKSRLQAHVKMYEHIATVTELYAKRKKKNLVKSSQNSPQGFFFTLATHLKGVVLALENRLEIVSLILSSIEGVKWNIATQQHILKNFTELCNILDAVFLSCCSKQKKIQRILQKRNIVVSLKDVMLLIIWLNL